MPFFTMSFWHLEAAGLRKKSKAYCLIELKKIIAPLQAAVSTTRALRCQAPETADSTA